MSIKINSLEYLGSINLARLFESPALVVARGSNAAYDVNRLWFAPLLGGVHVATIIPTPAGIREEMEAYGGNGVIDFDIKGVVRPWYVISVETTDLGPSVSIYIPEDADPEGAALARKAWGSAQ